MRKLLIAGCSGVCGTAVLEHFGTRDDMEVVTLSRSPRESALSNAHIAVDLLDANALARCSSQFKGITHVFYAVLKPSDDAGVEADENATMFEQLLDTISAATNTLEHVLFLQGGKVYGAHLGVYKTPAKEVDSRHFPPNLYFRHEDYACSAGKRQGWKWTALRPDVVIGHSVGSAMNLGNLIGVYGSLCRHLTTAMQFPGTAKAYDVLVNVTDGDIIAKAAEWSIEQKLDGAFNITNGDIFRWRHAWPRIAAYFGCEVGEPQPISLQDRLRSQADVWEQLVQSNGLQPHAIFDLGRGSFGDFIFHVESDAIFDTCKARQHGFPGLHRDSTSSILAHLDGMRDKGLIPNFR